MGIDEMVDAPRLHVDQIDGEFVVQHEPGIDVSLIGEQARLRVFEEPDMYFGVLNVAALGTSGRLRALADRRRHGTQFCSEY